MVATVQLFEMETSENSDVEFLIYIYVEHEDEVYSEEQSGMKHVNAEIIPRRRLLTNTVDGGLG